MKTFLQGIAGLLASKPIAAAARSKFDTAPEIDFIGSWGSGDPTNLEFLTTHAMDAILQHLHPAEIASLPRLIKISYDENGPLAVYEGEPGRSPARVLLSASDKYWAQYLYQFSHELGHVCCNFRRAHLRQNRFQWLEEAMCGAMSLYCLEFMAEHWPIPQGRPGHNFAPSLWSYLSERRRTYNSAGEIDDVRLWYIERAESLSETRTLTALNRPFAVWLVDRIRSDPGLFASYRYLNLGTNDRSSSLTEHLLRWKRYSLPGRDGLPNLLIAALGDVP